jgi:hypothetical protein
MMYTSEQIREAMLKQWPEIEYLRFREKVVEFMKERLPEKRWALMEDESKVMIRTVPDAFVINREAGEVVIFEIEVTHPVYKRMDKVLDVWAFFDQWEIPFGIITVDAYGRTAPLDPLHLLSHQAQQSDAAASHDDSV